VALLRKDFTICSSNLELLEACPATGCYVLEERSKSEPWHWWGIFLHKFLEIAVDQGREAGLAYLRSKKGYMAKKVLVVAAKIDVDSIPPGDTEVGFAHDVFADSARRLSSSTGTLGLAKEREQYGRADLLVPSTIPMVVDWKSGLKDAVDPQDSTQMLGLQAAVRAEAGAKEVDIALVGVLSSGELRWNVARISQAIHQRFLDRTRQVHLRVVQDRQRLDAGVEPEFIRSDHCDDCNLKPECPAYAK